MRFFHFKVTDSKTAQKSKLLWFQTTQENYFSLGPLSHQEVQSKLKSLGRDTSTGPDNITACYIKVAVDIICPPLTHIINSFINASLFPTLWKSAQIVPIGKIASPVKKATFVPSLFYLYCLKSLKH